MFFYKARRLSPRGLRKRALRNERAPPLLYIVDGTTQCSSSSLGVMDHTAMGGNGLVATIFYIIVRFNSYICSLTEVKIQNRPSQR